MTSMQVFLIAAMTADGFIARGKNDRSFDWTSLEDKKFYVSKIKQADAIVMGRNSFETFTRYPKNSRWVIYSSNPEKFSNPKPQVIEAEATSEDPANLVKRLESEGVKTLAICGGASIYSMFVRAGLIDRLYLTVEPILFGEGITLFSESFGQGKNLNLQEIHRLSEQTFVLEYSLTH